MLHDFTLVSSSQTASQRLFVATVATWGHLGISDLSFLDFLLSRADQCNVRFRCTIPSGNYLQSALLWLYQTNNNACDCKCGTVIVQKIWEILKFQNYKICCKGIPSLSWERNPWHSQTRGTRWATKENVLLHKWKWTAAQRGKGWSGTNQHFSGKNISIKETLCLKATVSFLLAHFSFLHFIIFIIKPVNGNSKHKKTLNTNEILQCHRHLKCVC